MVEELAEERAEERPGGTAPAKCGGGSGAGLLNLAAAVSGWTVMRVISTWALENEPESWRFCRDVFMRSRGCSQVGLQRHEDELAFWEHHIGSSSCRFGGSITLGGVPRFGFCVAERTEDGWEGGWVCVEQMAGGSGLADELYEVLLCEATRLDEARGLEATPWRVWVPEQLGDGVRFFAQHGWVLSEEAAREAAPRDGYSRWELPVR